MNITGGKYNSLIVKTADFANIKPTLSKIRQAVFNSLSSILEKKDDLVFCDLFAGSGIMSFEAVSRGYNTICVEIDKKSVKVIKENSERLKADIKIVNYDAVKFLQKTETVFDVIYIDPPYQSGLYDIVLAQIKNRNLLSENGIVIVEKPSELEVKTDGYNLIKEKNYSDKTIWYLKKV